jgi:hypothetical protein
MADSYICSVQYWVKHLKGGRKDITKFPHSGQPGTATMEGKRQRANMLISGD